MGSFITTLLARVGSLTRQDSIVADHHEGRCAYAVKELLDLHHETIYRNFPIWHDTPANSMEQ